MAASMFPKLAVPRASGVLRPDGSAAGPGLGPRAAWPQIGKELISQMEHDTGRIERQKNIALVAHDHKKHDLIEWARFNRLLLAQHTLYATGTTGKLLEQELAIPINKLQSGPLGGDQ